MKTIVTWCRINDKRFIQAARSVSDLKAHLVLTTKYRKKLITPAMLERLTEIVKDQCQKWG